MEIELDGFTYKIGKVTAKDQFHVARRLAPVLSKMGSFDRSGGNNLEALGLMAEALAKLSDFDADYCLFGLLKPITRKQAGGLGWAPISTENNLMFYDITMPTMLKLAWQSIQWNFSGFFPELPSHLPEDNQKQNDK